MDPHGTYLKVERDWWESRRNGTHFLRPDMQPVVRQIKAAVWQNDTIGFEGRTALLRNLGRLEQSGIPDSLLLQVIEEWLIALEPQESRPDNAGRFADLVSGYGHFEAVRRGSRRFAVFSGVDEEISEDELTYTGAVENLMVIGLISKSRMGDNRNMSPLDYATHDVFHANRPRAYFGGAAHVMQLFPFLSWQISLYLHRVIANEEKSNRQFAKTVRHVLFDLTHEMRRPYTSLHAIDIEWFARDEERDAAEWIRSKTRSLLKGILMQLAHEKKPGRDLKELHERITRLGYKENAVFLSSDALDQLIAKDTLPEGQRSCDGYWFRFQ
jgi:hypothetical protein